MIMNANESSRLLYVVRRTIVPERLIHFLGEIKNESQGIEIFNLFDCLVDATIGY